MSESRVGEIRQHGVDLVQAIRDSRIGYSDERLGGIVDFIEIQDKAFVENNPSLLHPFIGKVIEDIQQLEAGQTHADPMESTFSTTLLEPQKPEDSESAEDPTIEGTGSTTPKKTTDAGRADDPMEEKEEKPGVDLSFLS